MKLCCGDNHNIMVPELQKSETIKLNGSTKIFIDKIKHGENVPDNIKNGENVPSLEVVEVVLV